MHALNCKSYSGKCLILACSVLYKSSAQTKIAAQTDACTAYCNLSKNPTMDADNDNGDDLIAGTHPPTGARNEILSFNNKLSPSKSIIERQQVRSRGAV